MAKYYHGTSEIFDEFNFNHMLAGHGNIKYGYGLYFTEQFSQAAHYASKCNKNVYYVYTVDVPDLKDGNYISYFKGEAVNPNIVAAVERKLGEKIPADITADGKDFRKYVGKRLCGITKKTPSKDEKYEMEKAARDFFMSLGVEMYIWPVNWAKADGTTATTYTGTKEIAMLDASKIKIEKLHQVECDANHHYIEGTAKEVK